MFRRVGSQRVGGPFQARALVSRLPNVPALSRGREWDLSGLQAIPPVPLLRSRTPVEPTCPHRDGRVDAAPAALTAKASAMADFGANTQLRHLLPYASRMALPPSRKARFRLAGCAFTGRELNPLDRYERFQFVSSIILLSCSPDATTLRRPGRSVSDREAHRGRFLLVPSKTRG